MTALWNIDTILLDTILLDTILLIVASFLVIIIFILTIVQNFRRKPTIIGRTAIILLIMGLLFSTLLVFRGQELGAADWAQTLLMIGLVLVTAFYASSANRQADASVKMAEEMKKQRYDAVRPVIDIKPMEPQPMSLNIEKVTNKEREEAEYLSGLHCTLHNVGIGPAIDVYSFTLTVGGERIQKDFGILTTKGEPTPDVLLSPEQREEQWFLVAHYRDVYGRCFESSREIELDKEKNTWRIGTLKSQIAERIKK